MDLNTARVMKQPEYANRFVIEDAQGRVLKKKKSHCATHAPARFWKSRDAAQAVLDAMKSA